MSLNCARSIKTVDDILDFPFGDNGSSKTSTSSEFSVADHKYWKILLKNIARSYQSATDLFKHEKKLKIDVKKVFRKHKRVPEELFVYELREVREDNRLETENEWFKSEYASQIGEQRYPEEEKRLNKAKNDLKWQSKFIAFDRLFYAPPIRREPTCAQVTWKDTPLALICTCPATVCSCSCRKNSLLPAKKIPRKIRPNWYGVKSCLWALHILKYPTPTGALCDALTAAVEKEKEIYTSPEGRQALAEKGPEFCLSGCLQYLLSSSQENDALAAELAKMGSSPPDLGHLPDLKQHSTFEEIEDVTASYCYGTTCSLATQTDNDPKTDELMRGDFTHVMYATAGNTFMSNMDGQQLDLSFYTGEFEGPCAFSFSRVIPIEGMKHQISKMKNLYTSVSSMIDKYKTHLKSKKTTPPESLRCYEGCDGPCADNSHDEHDDDDDDDNDDDDEHNESSKIEFVIPWEKLKRIKSFIKKYLNIINLSDACDKNDKKKESKPCVLKPGSVLEGQSLINTSELSEVSQSKEINKILANEPKMNKAKLNVSFKDKDEEYNKCATCVGAHSELIEALNVKGKANETHEHRMESVELNNILLNDTQSDVPTNNNSNDAETPNVSPESMEAADVPVEKKPDGHHYRFYY